MRFNRFKEIFNLFFGIALAMMLTNIFSFIDAIMVSRYNVLGNSAISISSQIQFLFGPVYFAIVTGASIYTVQYYVRKEFLKLKNVAAISLIMMLPVVLINFLILFFGQHSIVLFFTKEQNELYQLSIDYLNIYKYSLLLVPIDIFFVYQYRAIKKTKIPLIIGVVQSIVNIIFNYLLIYGNFGFLELGIQGAAVATLISRIVGLTLNIIIAYKLKVVFLGKPQEMFNFSTKMFKDVVFNTIPLIVVEFGFGLGNVIYTKIYAMTDVVQFTAYNVARNLSLIINAFVMATASMAGIFIGSTIAKDLKKDSEELKDAIYNLFTFIYLFSFITLIFSWFILPLLIPLFTDKPEYYHLIKNLLIINGIWMAVRIFSSSFISILKSGNDNRFVIFIDAGVTFLVGIPITLIVVVFFTKSVIIARSMIIIETLCKALIGYIRYKQGYWIKKIH